MKFRLLIIAVVLFFGCQSGMFDKDLRPPENKILTFVHQYDHPQYADQQLPAPYGYAFYASLNQDVQFPLDTNQTILRLNVLLDTLKAPALIMLRLTNHQVQAISRGNADAAIDSLASTLKSHPHNIYLGVGFEVNNPRFGLVSSLYVQAHQRIVERFENLKVKNVSYVWHVIGMEPRWVKPIPLEACFPGEDYVDWVGLSMHNILPHHYPEDTYFKGSIYDKVSAFADEHDLPLMMCETSTRSVKTNFELSGDSLWVDWYKPFLKFVHDHDVRALCHIFYSFEDDLIISRWRQEVQHEQFIHSIE